MVKKRGMRKLDRVLIVVENLPSPFDRRVWMEATTLKKAGYEVSIIQLSVLKVRDMRKATK